MDLAYTEDPTKQAICTSLPDDGDAGHLVRVRAGVVGIHPVAPRRRGRRTLGGGHVQLLVRRARPRQHLTRN